MPSFVVMTMRRMIEIRYSVPQAARTDATIAFLPMYFDDVRSDPGRPCGRIDRRRCKDRMWDAQESIGGPDKIHGRFTGCMANKGCGAKQGHWASHAITARFLAGTAGHVFLHIHCCHMR